MPIWSTAVRCVFLRFLRWRIQLRHASTVRKASVALTVAIAALSPFWSQIRNFYRTAQPSTWIDVLLGTALLAVVPFVLAAYGGHIAAEASAASRRRSIKLKFWGLCVMGVLLAFAQQYRSVTEQEKTEEKTDKTEQHIVSMLTALHGSGVMTEAGRRKKILDVLRQKYILTHDVDQGMIDGTEAPPSGWVNQQLSSLGERWNVTKEPPAARSQPPARSYLVFVGVPVFIGRNPNGLEGSNFQPGDPLGFNVHYRATGPNPVRVGEEESATILEPNSQPDSLRNAYGTFSEAVRSEKRRLGAHSQPRWAVLMSGDERFFTALAWVGPLTNPRGQLILTQDHLDSLRAGTKIAVVLASITYKDGGKIHHAWYCAFLQPPAQPPGIWHYFDDCPNSN